jgi:hypothetical protein
MKEQETLKDGIYLDVNGEPLLMIGDVIESHGVEWKFSELPIDKYIQLTVMLNDAVYIGEL